MRERFPGRGSRECKGFQVRACFGKSREASVVGWSKGAGDRGGGEVIGNSAG